MSTLPRKRATNAGFSLVELMVSMVIALVLTLVISRVMIDHEGSKRSTTTLNDANQNGALAAYELDRFIRSAGSGFMQSWLPTAGSSLGCRINAKRGSDVLLPRPSAFPEPFGGVPGDVRLAPVIIHQGTNSDALTVLAGTAGFAEVSRAILGVSASTSPPTLRLANTLGWQQDDLVLVSAGSGECMLQQVGAVAPGTTDLLPLAGSYFSTSGTKVNLDYYGAETTAPPFAIALGNISTDKTRNNPPEFKLFGVDPTQHTLVSYDVLTQAIAEAPVPLADGVVAIRALYGIDNNLDGVQDAGNAGWQPPTGTFASTALLEGSSTAQESLRRIVSVRIGLIMRTSQVERKQIYDKGTKLDLFKDVGQTTSYELTGDELYIRHRTIEVTIPLRNVLLLPAVL